MIKFFEKLIDYGDKIQFFIEDKFIYRKQTISELEFFDLFSNIAINEFGVKKEAISINQPDDDKCRNGNLRVSFNDNLPKIELGRYYGKSKKDEITNKIKEINVDRLFFNKRLLNRNLKIIERIIRHELIHYRVLNNWTQKDNYKDVEYVHGPAFIKESKKRHNGDTLRYWLEYNTRFIWAPFDKKLMKEL